MSAVVVGIDVSKRFHVAHLAGQELTFSHTTTGFNAFKKWVSEVEPKKEFLIGLEPTGQFSKCLEQWLVEQRLKVVHVPGVYVNQAKKLLADTHNKTDRIDARVIAQLVQLGKFKKPAERTSPFEQLRDLSALHFRNKRKIVPLRNRMHALVDILFPELSSIISLRTKTAQAILRHYNHPDLIAIESFESFLARIKTGTFGRLSQKKLEKVHEASKDSLGRFQPTAALELTRTLDELDQMVSFVERIEESMLFWLNHIEYSEPLLTVPGVSPLTLGHLLGEVGDLKQYDSHKQIYKVVGVNLIEHSSGQSQSRAWISKDGRKLLRSHLYFTVLSPCTHPSGAWNKWYSAKPEKPAKVRLIAAVRRLLRICYAIAHSQMPYQSEYCHLRR